MIIGQTKTKIANAKAFKLVSQEYQCHARASVHSWRGFIILLIICGSPLLRLFYLFVFLCFDCIFYLRKKRLNRCAEWSTSFSDTDPNLFWFRLFENLNSFLTFDGGVLPWAGFRVFRLVIICILTEFFKSL